MNSAVIAILATVAFIVAYRVYGRHLAVKVFETAKSDPTPSHRFYDNVDFVPTNPWILFGHHFASIAGLGPIAGPAIALIWGWMPALAWVVIGSIFLGAVHDYAAIAISLRHDGKSIGDLTGMILGARGRVLFLVVVFFLLALSMGVFALLVAQIFTTQYPQTVIPVFALIVVAAGTGLAIYRYKIPIFPATMVGLVLTFLAVWLGIVMPVSMHERFISPATKAAVEAQVASGTIAAGASVDNITVALKSLELAAPVEDIRNASAKATTLWIYILLAYCFAASVLPVWLLLQPRDYLNSFQLYIGIVALFVGLLLAHPTIVAPAFQRPEGVPSFFPLLFITVACGAISGFHNLVASGTTARQLNRAADARPIVFGGMLVEALLAVIAILACGAGVGTLEKWQTFYNWKEAPGALAGQLAAFFYGSGTFLEQLWIPRLYGQTLVAVVVVGFAMTTLDTGTRLLRYNIEELADSIGAKKLVNRYLASFAAVVLLAFVALFKVPSAGPGGAIVYKPAGFIVWQLFGTSNQLLGALGLLIVTVYLIKTGKPSFYTAIPFAFMLFVTGWSLVERLAIAWSAAKPELRSWPVVIVGSILIVVTVWLAIEALVTVIRVKCAKCETAAGA